MNIGIDFFKRFERDELLELRGLIDSVLSEQDSELPLTIVESYRLKHVSVRAREALYNCDIDYWNELSSYSIFDLRKFRNVGVKTIDEIVEQLKLRGIELKS